MTNTFFDGFETGDFTAWTGTAYTSGATVSVVSSLKHTGGYCFKSGNVQNSGAGAYATKLLTSALSTAYLRTYIMVDSEPSGIFNFLTFRNNANGTIGMLQYSGVTHKWTAHMYINGSWTDYTQAATTQIVANQWLCVEFEVAVSSTVGVVSVWVNGIQLLNQTGVNTAARGNIDLFYVGPYNIGGTQSVAVNSYYDDIAMADSYIGPMAVSWVLQDSLSSVDNSFRNKPAVIIPENIGTFDLTLNNKILLALENIGTDDSLFVSKVFLINEGVCLFETVEQGIRKKNKLFLVLGDLAIQLSGD